MESALLEVRKWAVCRIGLFDGLMAGAAWSGPRHQSHRESYHANRSFKPTCRAPCRSGLKYGTSEVNWPGFGWLMAVLGVGGVPDPRLG